MPKEDHTGSIVIINATSAALVEAACRLRYETFVVEGGDRRYADDARGLHVDQYDVPGSNIWVAIDRDDVVGTLRLVDRASGPYLGDEHYGWETLAEAVNNSVANIQQHSVIISRGAVARSHRRTGLFNSLCDVFEARSRAMGAKYILGVVAAANDPSFKLLKERGYFAYHEDIFPSGWSGRCICKQLEA